MIKVAEEAIRRNYLKEDLGWISENLHLVTDRSYGIYCLNVVLHVIQ